MSAAKKITYKQSGVNYDAMDLLKRMAQQAGLKTTHNLQKSAFSEVIKSRGESAYVLELTDFYLAFVEEGLGTKSLVADEMYPITGKSYYDQLAQDTIAMIVNDLITVGAKPVTILAYWAAGSSKWFEDTQRMEDLVEGWAKACNLSGAVWGGGETPTLTGIMNEQAIDLAGAAFGIIQPKTHLTLGDNLQVGDRIIIFESSGIHANGLTLARKIAEQLSNGYKTTISDGRMYGEALLDPTSIYAKLIDDLFEAKIDIHYMANITGHGWRKLMRLNKEFTYRITDIPPVPPVLQFIKEEANLDDKEAYGNLNMGAGYVVFVSQKDVKKIITIAKKNKIMAYDVGVVEKGKKQVIIEPLNITFQGDSLQVRA